MPDAWTNHAVMYTIDVKAGVGGVITAQGLGPKRRSPHRDGRFGLNSALVASEITIRYVRLKLRSNLSSAALSMRVNPGSMVNASLMYRCGKSCTEPSVARMRQ